MFHLNVSDGFSRLPSLGCSFEPQVRQSQKTSGGLLILSSFSRRPFIQNVSKVPIIFLLMHLRLHIIFPGNKLLVKEPECESTLAGTWWIHAPQQGLLWILKLWLALLWEAETKRRFLKIFLPGSSWLLELIQISVCHYKPVMERKTSNVLALSRFSYEGRSLQCHEHWFHWHVQHHVTSWLAVTMERSDWTEEKTEYFWQIIKEKKILTIT